MDTQHHLSSPFSFLRHKIPDLTGAHLQKYDAWWRESGRRVSTAIDRAGTPWLRMFSATGQREDFIEYPAEYWTMLREGYKAGIIWRTFAENSLLPFYVMGYLSAYYDPGLFCPYTVSLSTAVPLSKYGEGAVKSRYLPKLLAKDDSVWQGATWMTEVKGGSDLGMSVETIAQKKENLWQLSGDKYFASNAGAELAVVAARPENARPGVRGLALYLLPKFRQNGELNYTIRRLKDKIATRSVPTGEVELRESEAYLLGREEWGIYLILEVLNLSRVANSIASVALAQRALSDAYDFASRRRAFGKPIVEHPLLKKQFEQRLRKLDAAFALSWEAVSLLEEVWEQKPPYSDRYHLFRLVAHVAKFWTADFAADTARWTMEVYGGMGTLAEFGMDRWLREAMILSIWEGTAHRQILDGLEVMVRKNAHKMLLKYLKPFATGTDLKILSREMDAILALPQEQMEAAGEEFFRKMGEMLAKIFLGRAQ